jgi:phosphoglycerate-specific signal transduction histidine kinase
MKFLQSARKSPRNEEKKSKSAVDIERLKERMDNKISELNKFIRQNSKNSFANNKYYVE